MRDESDLVPTLRVGTHSDAPRPSRSDAERRPHVPTRSVGTRDIADPSSLIPHPSSFILLLDPPASGAWNMAVDEALLEAAAAEGQSDLRFYRWAEPTLSLGYFQTYGDRFQHEASRGVCGGPSPERRRGHPPRPGADLQPRGARAPPAGRQPAADVSGGSSGPDRRAGPVGDRGRDAHLQHGRPGRRTAVKPH